MTRPSMAGRRARGFTLFELLVSMAILSLVVGAVTLFLVRYMARIGAQEATIALEREARLFQEQVAADLAAGDAVLSGHGPHATGFETLVVRKLPPVSADGTVGAPAVVVYTRDTDDPTRLLRLLYDADDDRPEALPREVTTAAVDVEFASMQRSEMGLVWVDIGLHRRKLDEEVHVVSNGRHLLGRWR